MPRRRPDVQALQDERDRALATHFKLCLAQPSPLVSGMRIELALTPDVWSPVPPNVVAILVAACCEQEDTNADDD